MTLPQSSAMLHDWVNDSLGLVSPPDVCAQLFELLDSPDASAREISDLIGRDPNLTARLLKIVNSPFFGFTKRVDTVTRAVALVGMRELYNLVIAVSAVSTFSNIAVTLVNMDTFWRHSVYTGLLARAIAKRRAVLHPERLFVAGLLHDIGSLIVYQRVPELIPDLLCSANHDEEALHRVELEALGFSHADVGGLLLQAWLLPPNLQLAVRCHHQPADAAHVSDEASMVHVANVLANRSPESAFCETSVAATPIDPEAWQRLQFADEDLPRLTAEANGLFAQTVTMLGIAPG
jgi:HD-like signal output (HDOD) protein